MSYKLQNRVDECVDLPTSAQRVLRVLAWRAQEDGSRVRPKVSEIVAKSGLSESTVRRQLDVLEKTYGLISVVTDNHGGRGRAIHFKINVEKLFTAPAATLQDFAKVALIPCQNDRLSFDEYPVKLGEIPCQNDRLSDGNPVKMTGFSTAYIDNTPRQETPRHSLQGAREVSPKDDGQEFQHTLKLPITGGRADPGKAEPCSNLSKVDAAYSWTAIWAAFCAWPYPNPSASEALARAAWLAIADEINPARFLACVQAHGRRLVADNERRGRRIGPVLCPCPHNWITRDRGWTAYLGEVDIVATTEPPRPELPQADIALLLKAGFDMGAISGRFAYATFVRAAEGTAPIGLIVQNNFLFGIISDRYGDRLRRAFGDGFTITLATQPGGAACRAAS